MNERVALKGILEPGGLRPLFQPIVDVSGDADVITSVECLMRGPIGTNLESAKVLFDYVRFKREEIAVDRACVSSALREARHLPSNLRLSLNVHACTLGRDHGFVEFLTEAAAEHDIELHRLSLEIVEHAPPWDGASFLAALELIRERGMSIALDDVGLGQSNFKMIFDAQPDYLKVDRFFITGLATDPRRRAVVESIAFLGRHFNAQLIAEGVEDASDLAAAKASGITLIQGYYFHQPMTADGVAQVFASAASSHPRVPSA
jgi:EAL domain-containing protein (putative c-di-GMP-specific phosphodiesterase class I)